MAKNTKTIRYEPKYRIDEIDFIHSFGLEKYPHFKGISRWEYLEEKTIPENLEIMIVRKYEVLKAKLWTALLESDSSFKILQNGKWTNPFFTCHKCEKETLSEYVFHKNGYTLIPLWDEDKRYCPKCFWNDPKIKLTPDGVVFDKGNE